MALLKQIICSVSQNTETQTEQTHFFLYIAIEFQSKKALEARSSHSNSKPHPYVIPFIQEEYVRKGLSAPSLGSREQSQAAKLVMWPSARVCTFHTSSLSLPFIFYQQYFLNCSNSVLWQTDILQQPNQSWDFSFQFPNTHPSLCLFLLQRERFIPIFISFNHVILCRYFSLLSFWSFCNLLD